jgi:hypothetical protein
MRFANMQLLKIELRKFISLLMVNVTIILAALWLVSHAPFPIGELITDSKMRQKY